MGKTKSINKLNNFLQKATKLINNSRIIKNIYKHPLYNDEPKIFAYSASYKTKYRYNSDVASGFSFNKNIALIRVLGEAIERYCLDHFDKKALFEGVAKDIKAAHLNPLSISYFSKRQIRDIQFKVEYNSRFRWIKATSLTKEQVILIPAQLGIFNYKIMKNEPTILLPTSTGTAEGLTLNDAIYRGICEVVERDAFMISYLNQLSSTRVDLNSLNDEEIKTIIKKLKRYKLELLLLDLTTDLQIPAFSAITLDRTRLGPAISIGLKAGFNVKDTIIGAIEESLMVRFGTRDQFAYEGLNHEGKKIISAIDDRTRFWFPLSGIEHLDFWLKSKNLKKINIKNFDYAKNTLKMAIELLKEKNMDLIYIDIADRKIKRYGFTVLKVTIPQLHPLYLDESYSYVEGKRLHDTPVKMGFFKKARTKNQLNKILHPFL